MWTQDFAMTRESVSNVMVDDQSILHLFILLTQPYSTVMCQ